MTRRVHFPAVEEDRTAIKYKYEFTLHFPQQVSAVIYEVVV